MPAGTSWPRYLTAVSAMMLSMFAGAQTVHFFYNPLQDLDFRVESEKEKLLLVRKEEDKMSVSSPVHTNSASSSSRIG
ncbi:hypothetical protein ElyMa_002676200 [Elysia marginata]|uniref:Uncharacterized protein n=1 Tax=Elysia marginata TaxID=1093978 RepID=A0AAV4HA21_9GAST|nr:hypothetical protein ElyMa_002676200 [Elysia marginata]